jgi:hypothetical protein
MIKFTAVVPWVSNCPGSTVTVTVAGVVPLAGEIVTPGVVVEMLKSVALPPGSLMVKLSRNRAAVAERGLHQYVFMIGRQAVRLIQRAYRQNRHAAIGMA